MPEPLQPVAETRSISLPQPLVKVRGMASPLPCPNETVIPRTCTGGAALPGQSLRPPMPKHSPCILCRDHRRNLPFVVGSWHLLITAASQTFWHSCKGDCGIPLPDDLCRSFEGLLYALKVCQVRWEQQLAARTEATLISSITTLSSALNKIREDEQPAEQRCFHPLHAEVPHHMTPPFSRDRMGTACLGEPAITHDPIVLCSESRVGLGLCIHVGSLCFQAVVKRRHS